MTLAFVPVSGDDLAAWATSGVLPGPRDALAVTPALLAAFGFSEFTDEGAEHEVLCQASIVSLIRYGRRLVAVGEADVVAPGDLFGRVQIGDMPYERVLSIFRDAVEAPIVDDLAPIVQGQTLEQALDLPEVQHMLSETELLWYGPTEWPEAIED